jgi:heterodisulfide reductase subunit A-like polyferredoxin
LKVLALILKFFEPIRLKSSFVQRWAFALTSANVSDRALKVMTNRSARVVIIGGGIMGASLLYHLAELGWTDCILVEKDELTSGSTWHAAGQCPSITGSYNLAKIHA